MAVDHAPWQIGQRLFRREVDDGHDAFLQKMFRVTAIACIADPELVWKDFTHGSSTLSWFAKKLGVVHPHHEKGPLCTSFLYDDQERTVTYKIRW